jgi:hypothetical protein
MIKIHARTSTPTKLVNEIKKTINDGLMKTWLVKDLKDRSIVFYHSTNSGQWEEVLINPIVNENEEKVTFLATYYKSQKEPGLDKTGYVVGRFVEALLVHLGQHFYNLAIEH